MRNFKQNAQRWIKEAEYTLNRAEQNCREESYSLACFLAEQTSQKALKAVLYFDGARFINIHSITELIKEVSRKRPEFLDFIKQATTLDHYYLSTRYPDAVPEPAIPSEIFVKEQAEEAVSIAGKIFNASKKALVE
ncbi:MAG: HEPN domain-containing protein [Patescibacteria group bacterium]